MMFICKAVRPGGWYTLTRTPRAHYATSLRRLTVLWPSTTVWSTARDWLGHWWLEHVWLLTWNSSSRSLARQSSVGCTRASPDWLISTVISASFSTSSSAVLSNKVGDSAHLCNKIIITRNKSNASFEALQYRQDLTNAHYHKRKHFPIYTCCSENHNNTCAENW